MQMNDKQKITIQLAELPRIPLAVTLGHEEEMARKAEKLVNERWTHLSRQFANENSLMVMARVAFQYAMLYVRSEHRHSEIEELNRELDALLHDLPGLE